MARHAEFMEWLVKKQIQRSMQASDLLYAATAKSRLAEMLKNGNLLDIFEDEISH